MKNVYETEGRQKYLKNDASLGDFSIKRTFEFFSCFNKSDSFLHLSLEEWK